jgi:NADH-quinone oxidoreductase subunit N
MLVLIADAFTPARRAWLAMWIGLLGAIAALVATLTLIGDPRSTFGGMFVVDDFAVLFKVFFLIVAIAVMAISLRYFRDGGFYQGEYYYLLLTAFLAC